MTDLVFVYGTLKRNNGNHLLLAASTFVGEAKIKGAMIAYSPNFPGVCAVGSDDIYGEVYSVTPLTLHALDRLEGHPKFYERRKTIAFQENSLDGELVWCYFLPDQLLQEGHYQRIASGKWEKQA